MSHRRIKKYKDYDKAKKHVKALRGAFVPAATYTNRFDNHEVIVMFYEKTDTRAM